MHSLASYSFFPGDHTNNYNVFFRWWHRDVVTRMIGLRWRRGAHWCCLRRRIRIVVSVTHVAQLTDVHVVLLWRENKKFSWTTTGISLMSPPSSSTVLAMDNAAPSVHKYCVHFFFFLIPNYILLRRLWSETPFLIRCILLPRQEKVQYPHKNNMTTAIGKPLCSGKMQCHKQ